LIEPERRIDSVAAQRGAVMKVIVFQYPKVTDS
jgi:hypothetical protein